MNKKITFHSDSTEFEILRPRPSSKDVPKSYRKMHGVKEGIMSVKKCVPFLDSMTAGYTIPLPVDVSWNKEREEFEYLSKVELISRHDTTQIEGFSIGEGYSPIPHKWSSHWFIKTPKGYSTLFVHPLNRTDLPFYSFSGIVETDRHPVIVNFPFVLKKDFEGIIEAGTPMIQAIPFKRDNWNSEILDDGQSHFYPFVHKIMEPPFGFYKRNFWKRKEFR